MMSPAARQIVSNLTGVLVQAAHPKRIILFGSQARGDAAPHSDFDIMCNGPLCSPPEKAESVTIISPDSSVRMRISDS